MMAPLSDYAALILAGGESSRMGTDKTRLIISGRTMVERTALILEPIVSSLVIMMNQRQETLSFSDIPKGKIVIARDSVPRRGPLGAIADSLPHIPDSVRFVFLTASDLPYLTTDWFIRLRDKMNDRVDVVYSVDDNITNPLLALYRKELLLAAPHLLAQNRNRPVFLWEDKRTVGVTPPKDAPRLCRDMNYRIDYEKARKELNS